MNEEKMNHTFKLLAELPVDVLDKEAANPLLSGLKQRFLRSYGEGDAPGKLTVKVIVSDLGPAELEATIAASASNIMDKLKEFMAANENNLAPCNDMNPAEPKE